MLRLTAPCLSFYLCAGPVFAAGEGMPALSIEPQASGIARGAAQINVKDFGAIGDGLADDTRAIAAALAAIDKDRGGILRFPRGFYRIARLSLDGFNGLTLQGEVGTYFLSTTAGTLVDVLDCRDLRFDALKFLGRSNANPVQDATPTFTGLSAPARFVYIHERPAASKRRQSEFISLSRCLFFHCAGTAVEVGDGAAESSAHQPSDVYFDDVKIAETVIGLKVSQVNAQGIYCRRFSASSVTDAVFHLAAGDLFAKDVQVSGLGAAAYLVKVVQARDDEVKRVIIENYWDETSPGGVLKTNLARVSDGITLGITRFNPVGTDWPFDIQCKNTTVRITGMDSSFAAAGSTPAMLRVNQSTRLIMGGTFWTLAGSPTCRFEVIDDQGRTLETYATQQLAEPALPFASAIRENLIPGAGTFATLEDRALHGDGINAFKISTSGELEVDKRTSGTLVAWTDYFQVDPGATYAASILMSEEPAGMGALWSLFFYDEGGTLLGEAGVASGENRLSGIWLAKAGVVTAPPRARNARVRVGTTGPGHLRFRHLKVERGSYVTPFLLGPARAARILLEKEPTSGFWKAGEVFQRLLPSGGLVNRICVASGFAVKEGWAQGAFYQYGDYVISNAKVYQCASDQGRAGTVPPFHTSGTASDGQLIWRFVTPSGPPRFQNTQGPE
ncbi:MAG: glycosyl hydrolase family 28-related protein [Holophagaceae bacterium]